MIKDPVERSNRFAELMWEMQESAMAGTLTRASYVRLAKRIVTVMGDGFAHNCILAGTGNGFRAWKKVKNWARRRHVKPYTMGLGP